MTTVWQINNSNIEEGQENSSDYLQMYIPPSANCP